MKGSSRPIYTHAVTAGRSSFGVCFGVPLFENGRAVVGALSAVQPKARSSAAATGKNQPLAAGRCHPSHPLRRGRKTLARVATFLSDLQRSFAATLRTMMTTNHLGTAEAPKVHPVVASSAREVLNKSENERSGVRSTAMSFLGLCRDPTVAAVTAASDWCIADLVAARHPVSLYLVVPPSDISRTKPLIR